MKYKYMRIQGRENSYVTQYPKGVFSLCWNLIRDDLLDDNGKELFLSIDNWFRMHLPEPEPCVNHEKVITFFKCDSTGEMLSRLEPAMALLDKYKKEYDVVYTNFIGAKFMKTTGRLPSEWKTAKWFNHNPLNLSGRNR